MKEKKESVFFENIQHHIINNLKRAKESIRICVAWITWDVYAPHLRNLAERGVDIKIIYNNDDKNVKSEILKDVHGIALYPISARKYSSLMHNKFCIIDDSVLMTGSFNWSRTAESHFENIVILQNHYQLVSSFRHEFYDLISYFDSYQKRVKIVCGRDDGNKFPCRSHVYHVGVFGGASGIHESSTVSVWRICNAYKHAEVISISDEIFINSNLLGTNDDFEEDEIYDLDSMRENYAKERNKIQRVRDYFQRRHGIHIHAVGFVDMTNGDEYIKGYDQYPEYALQIIWTDMYYRKVVPTEIYEGESDDIENLIHDEVNSAY
ncbi:hypothetical protein CFN58_07600 [Pseudomonas avellanae]|uniref:phospholipase D n=2 Tax=Pseudomonas syringae group TaxID=136849 RepID=A0A261WL94_9PSED|nr:MULTISPECIES: phospholipase D-like domain-containing protein [Pseudomonas syringae group]OZI86928.1 hypothetical protein CFN58_07600 [Pseudomonas avellanae]ATV16753.1 hypothetical protein CT122_07360 [Pseudomonas syringae pv. actinidiae]KPB34190.1 Uncharacterized protein AC515_2425 [Pseudomonas savastanoi pv. phaseolicola]NYS42708.1 hypothetical protein [Pseudomonas syringae pv. actinidiae]PIN57676.1 hypothetical protein CUB86_32125 [Pseudomonas syringae pv. actinidiae]